MTNTYRQSFWNAMRGKNTNLSALSDKMDNNGGYQVPDESKAKLDQSLARDNVFRRLGTLVRTTSPEGTIQAVASTGTADWIEDGQAYIESSDTITQFPVNSYKLASLVRLKESFVGDTSFDIENYLLNAFARRFGRAEEAMFLTGTGVDQPTGLLGNNGAQVGITAASETVITYDDVVKLYFSLKPDYRVNAVFLMHDDTAMALRTIKDSAGNPIWNSQNDTIFSKPVITTPSMPIAASGTKPIVFGELSYYWVVERQALAIKRLKELYAVQGQIGFTAYERLDGKLILPEAVKALKMAE